jgi:hypothetical protein
MLEQRSWKVEIRLAYDVTAGSAEQALGAVLPLLSLGPDRYGPQPRIADYTVREIATEAPSTVARGDPLQGLTKPVFTAKEAAAILGLSLNSVYTRIPSMNIGRLRRFTRAAILNVIEHGVESEPMPIPEPVRYHRPRHQEKPAKVMGPAPEKLESPILTLKAAANLLRISRSKLIQLLDEMKIYYSNSYGRRTIPRQAVQNYIDGLPPRAFIEKELSAAKDHPMWRNDLKGLEDFAKEWRAKWPDARYDNLP